MDGHEQKHSKAKEHKAHKYVDERQKLANDIVHQIDTYLLPQCKSSVI